VTLRQVVLDTETTGLEVEQGHRVIEIGCVELIDRRRGGEFHRFINPGREIDVGAQNVHGISNEALADKPRFAEIADDLLAFIEGAELIIHNAPFDVGFLNAELRQCGRSERLEPPLCTVTDSLALARRLHPGSVPAWTRCADATKSTTRAANCTARCSMPSCSPRSGWR
jgi:DNA polymerase III, epsilon subunit (EC 2.7.7.7)